jgi:uncharacterized membrane protein YphA (DoxX/SURF4 family)
MWSFIFAGGLVVLIGISRRLPNAVLIAVTFVAWLALPAYNALILRSCPGDCAIRVDLILVVPLLIALTARSAFLLWRSRSRGNVADEKNS